MTRHTPLAFILMLVFAVASAVAPPAMASSSRAWVLRNKGDFQNARLEGVALTTDGALRLSARVTPLADPSQLNIWSIARDAKGRLYAGAGNDGRVFRFVTPDSAPEVVFDSDELEVQSLAFDSKGRLFAATTPHGAVYMVTDDGIGVTVFRPDDTYIWSILFDERDRLYVATGQGGHVYRVDAPGPNATGQVVLDGREEHIRSLARSARGDIYAGSDQSGILYRIGRDGAVSVVYDSPMQEVASIAIAEGAKGEEIYIGTLAPMPAQRGGQSGRAQNGGVTRVRVTADDSGTEPDITPGEQDDDTPEQQSQRQRTQARPPTTTYTGAIYAVGADGYARKLWESRESLPLSLAVTGGTGRSNAAGMGPGILVGTGNDGHVLLLGEDGDVTEFVTVPSQQVNALIEDGAGGWYAAASNLGQVVRIEPGAAASATVTGSVLDAGFTSSWGAIAWDAETPRGSSVSFEVRTGNTEEPDGSWSAWSPAYTDAGGTVIERPRARYLQWRARLEGGPGGRGPILRNIRINYLQDNLPPEINTVDVLPPGLVLTGSGSSSPDQGEGSPSTRRSNNQPRRSFEKGKLSAAWQSGDGNDDALQYDVYFKAEDETLWKPLARDLSDEFCSWDATAMPDGVYRIKVTATDAPSNPPGAALTGSRISAAFDVDNTPPVVGALDADLVASRQGPGRAADISVTVTDTFSVIGDVTYSLDAGDWITVLPEDRIADSMKESYRFSTSTLEPGEHTVTVRARDRAGNTAANKVVIRVER